MERSPKLMPTRDLALRFLAGKYKGSEISLSEGQELTFGRVGDVDVVLAEDMVSRRHARIVHEGSRVFIEDLGSTNGTFVNGEKIQQESLKEGDRILIGTNILKLVPLDASGHGVQRAADLQPLPGSLMEQTRAVELAADSETGAMAPVPRVVRVEEIPSSVRARNVSGSAGASRSMSGDIHEFPLPYLLQLLESSQKNGVLVIRAEDEDEVAKLYLRKGLVVFASINDIEDTPPLKIAFRVLTWARGTFDLEPPEERAFPSEIHMSVQELLMEGLRQIDELNNIRPKLPEGSARLVVPRPLRPRLRDLTPVELDTLQLALNYGVMMAVMDRSQSTDLDTARAVLKLVDSGYLRVS